MFSRTDGASDEHQIALATGLPESEVKAALDRLYELGAIEFSAGEKRPAGEPVQQGAREERTALYDPAELHEDAELELDRKRAVLELYYGLDRFSHYELLGLHPSADKKAVKRAYYDLAPLYHPDSYFRKRLGSFKPKIEAIFTRLTLAHDVLTHRVKRAEYDQSLHETGALAAGAEPAAPVEAGAAAPTTSEPLNTPPDGQGTPAPGWETIEMERIRRQALARRLALGRRSPGAGSGISSTLNALRGAAQTGAAGDVESAGFRAGAAPNADEAGKSELEQWISAAVAAHRRGDAVAFADALRNAVALAPERQDLRQRWQRAHERAQAVLAEAYLKQAAEEASKENWLQAAWNYAKAASMLPQNAAVHERVAAATLACGGSAQRAVEYAQRAVELSPDDAAAHITLARAHMADGAVGPADFEARRALSLAPGTPSIEAAATELLNQILPAMEERRDSNQAAELDASRPRRR